MNDRPVAPLNGNRKAHLVLAAAAAALLLAGCGTDYARVRRDQTADFSASLAIMAEEELARPLSLDDCVRIAMRNNYDARKADLDKELQRIGRQVAFTAFLPNVAASAGYNAYEKDPGFSERRFSTAGLNATMPVFMPSTWFLYMAARQGYASAEIAANYVRQGIVLQTTADYLSVMVQQDVVKALESQVAAARETSARVRGLADEGLARKWEADQALQLAEAREIELNSARRQEAVLRGELLQGMGFSPLAAIQLSGEMTGVIVPEGSIEELVLKALEIHPRLALADRQVVIQNQQVRQAFCNFLPTVSLFASGTWTSDDLAVHSTNWVSGFQGVWTLFDGFANVARYKAAKVERRRSELDRESEFLSIIVQVIAADAGVRDASEAVRLRQRAYDVAAARFADYDARAREGLLPISDALDARAVMDAAQVELARSRYRERMAAANLELAMGLTAVPDISAGPKEGK